MAQKRRTDAILLICNCEKYKHKALLQKQTWLKKLHPSIPYFHVVGDPFLPTAWAFDYKNNVLCVRAEDDYNSLPSKVVRAFEAVDHEYDYKYIFKTDDDQHVKNTEFFKTLERVLCNRPTPTPIHYGGFIVNVRQQHISQYYKIHSELPTNMVIQAIKYCSGRFYFLSKCAASYIISQKEKIQLYFLEDYGVGLILNGNGVLKKSIMMLDTQAIFTDAVPVATQNTAL